MDSEQPMPLKNPPSPQRLPVTVPEAAVMKLTRGHSCVLCQQRKVRCDRQKPCANCVKAQVECKVVPPQPPRRRKKKLVERDYAEQVKRIKTALSRAGINYADLIDDNPDDVEDLEQGLNGLKTSPSSTADYASPGRGHDRSVPWRPYLE